MEYGVAELEHRKNTQGNHGAPYEMIKPYKA